MSRVAPTLLAFGSGGMWRIRGFIDPGLAMPVTVGVLLSSLAGAWLLVRAPSQLLRIIFILVILLLGLEMIYNGLTGKL